MVDRRTLPAIGARPRPSSYLAIGSIRRRAIRIFRLLLLTGLALSSGARAQAPSLGDTDRVRLAEALALAAAVEDCIWPGWSSVPFAVLLLAGEHEYLVRHPRRSSYGQKYFLNGTDRDRLRTSNLMPEIFLSKSRWYAMPQKTMTVS